MTPERAVARIHAYAPSCLLLHLCEPLVFTPQALQARIALFGHLPARHINPGGHVISQDFRQLCRFSACNPRAQPGLDVFTDHLTCSTQFTADPLGLGHERVEDPILLTLGVGEVPTGNYRRRLKLAVNPPIALLEARGVPGQVKMKQVMTSGLQVDPFPGGIRTDENADGGFLEGGVEGALDPIPSILIGSACEDQDALIRVDAEVLQSLL